MSLLEGQVAVVAGASRGAGKGVALASDHTVMAKIGKLLNVADIAEEYGFTDIDGQFVPRFVAEPSP